MIRNSHITTAIIAINNSIVTNKSAKVLMGRELYYVVISMVRSDVVFYKGLMTG